MFNRKIVLFLILFSYTSLSQAYFQDNVLGARPAGMGGAFTGLSDDANSILYNPAGYSRVRSPQITGMAGNTNYSIPDAYQNQKRRQGYGFAGAVIPGITQSGSIAAGWTRFDSGFYNENIFIFGYGQAWQSGSPVSFGVNLKLLQWSLSDQETANHRGYEALHKNGVTFDLGFLSAVSENASLGIAFENILAADMSVRDKDSLPLIVRSGFSYKIAFSESVINIITPSFELCYLDSNLLFKAGAEAWLFDHVLALRLGGNRDELSIGSGFYYKSPTSGMVFQFDYAFSMPYHHIDSLGAHRVGITLGWLEEKKDEKVSRQEEKEQEEKEYPERSTEDEAADEKMNSDEEIRLEDAEKKVPEESVELQLEEETDKTRIPEITVSREKLSPIVFEINKKELSEESRETLRYLAGLLNENQKWQATIAGHACILGTKEYNQWLSEERAGSVKRMLTSEYGVRSSQVTPIGYGNSRPIASNETESGREKNRRVEIVIKDDGSRQIYP